MPAASELVLAAEPDAATKARRFVATELADAPGDTVGTAELVVTELVTNSVLHAAAPIVVRVKRTDGGARIEVEDGGRDLPIAPPLNPHSMTGRGLALVAATTAGWGVEPAADGRKIVWAEVSSGPSGASLHSLAGLDLSQFEIPGADSDEPVFTVRLGSVPTDLLLAAKGHVDNVLREFHLVTAGSDVTESRPPPELVELIDTMAEDFALARTEIKRQAVAAADRGDVETDLVLTLPVSAAAAGERYLAALDKVDAYARNAALLTLETPPAHRVFRQWYVQGLIDRLRALAAGGPLPVVPSFPQALAAEVTRLSTLRDVSDRLSRLQLITGELSQARGVADIAETLTSSAARHLDATGSAIHLLRGAVLEPLAAGGEAAAHVVDLAGEDPLAEVARSRRPMELRGRAAGERFPGLAARFAEDRTVHIAPLVVGAECIGVLTVTFPLVGLDEESRSSIVTTLADTLAQALERAISSERVAEANAKLAAANERLAFIADASIVLSGTLDYDATLQATLELMVPRFADWCSVQLAEDGALRMAAIAHVDPERNVIAQEMMRRYPVQPNTDIGTGRAIRTMQPELFDDVTADMLATAAVDLGHLELLHQLGSSSALVVPFAFEDEISGVLTLVYADDSRRYVASDVPFAQDIARRVAAALRSAAAYREKTGQLADIRRVADAAQRAILAPPPARIGPVALAARYIGAAAEAQVGGDLYEVVARRGSVRLLIGDVRGKGLSAVRMATIVLGEFRAVAAELADLPAVATQLDRRLRPHLGEEDFVTALLAEIADDGSFSVTSCGHPPALLLTGSQVTEVGSQYTVPLGLGVQPGVDTGRLSPGDRLLLYTDGAIETRDPQGRFLDFVALLRPELGRDHLGLLDAVLTSLRARAGRSRLNDDLALLIAEYRGPA
ncbi:SpoIIE family protein phosphatase [Sporichthya polymorpha]|uniref:SpoIIE family protein phosphatase n=1 Tax=Sporichthya polymorpha TaxID=35751 RepID=UPI000366FBB2|nr:SpoIIE family protein phosphatase [Sporichthya polymorpha]